jgi:hypothetical protein
LSTKLDIISDLPASNFKPYSEALEFAGISKRSKILCTDQPGTPNISGVPVRPATPENWVTFSGYILTQTKNPRLTIVPDRYWREVCIHPDDLLPRFTVESSSWTGVAETDQYLNVELSEVPHLHATYPKLRIAMKGNTLMVAFPKDMPMQAKDWQRLERYVFTGQTQATFSDTAKIEDRDALWFSGVDTAAIKHKWGVEGAPTFARFIHSPKIQLGFTDLTVIDPAKAAKVFNFLAFAKQVHVSWYDPGTHEIPMEQVLANPRLLKKLPASWRVTSDGAKFRLTPDTALSDCIDKPLTCQGFAFISAARLDEFFVPVRKAARVRKLNAQNDYRQVYTSDKALSGNFVLKQHFDKAETRNIKEETQALREREAKLKEQMDFLPSNWHTYSDEKLLEFHRLRQEEADGKIIDSRQSQMLPQKESSTYHKMLSWLRSHGQVQECPVTNNLYIPNYQSIDELVELPGFIPALYEALGDKTFFSRLLTSEKARGFALVEAI